MDTQLYKWKEENQQINKQDDDNNIIIQDQGLQENQIVPLANAIDKKRARVRKNMPEGIGVFSQKQNLIRTGKYRFIDSSGNAHDAKRTVQFLDFRIQAPDHPALLQSEEQLYLKCMILRVK